MVTSSGITAAEGGGVTATATASASVSDIATRSSFSASASSSSSSRGGAWGGRFGFAKPVFEMPMLRSSSASLPRLALNMGSARRLALQGALFFSSSRSVMLGSAPLGRSQAGWSESWTRIQRARRAQSSLQKRSRRLASTTIGEPALPRNSTLYLGAAGAAGVAVEMAVVVVVVIGCWRVLGLAQSG